MTGGTACPVENTSELCGDGIDNDGNGFTDCDDNSCVIGAPTCRAVTTIASIDQAVDANPASPTLPTGGIEIDDAYVTAISGNNFWISSSATAAADSGLYVFAGPQTLPAASPSARRST